MYTTEMTQRNLSETHTVDQICNDSSVNEMDAGRPLGMSLEHKKILVIQNSILNLQKHPNKITIFS